MTARTLTPTARAVISVGGTVFSAAAIFAGGNLSRGVREARDTRWVVGVVAAIAVLHAFLPAWTDRRSFWTIDGDGIRWFGVALTAIGGALRIAPVYVLGDRFSGLVAIQPNHLRIYLTRSSARLSPESLPSVR